MRPRCLAEVGVWAFAASCLVATDAAAQEPPRLFVGMMAGVSTLSADARSVASSSGAALSLYKPENGPTLNVLVGIHTSEFVSFQASYRWNRNAVELVEASLTGADSLFIQQARRSSQHAAIGDVLVYFRERDSRVRPYLSGGLELVRFVSRARNVPGDAEIAPASLSSTHAALRVAVGMDLALGRGWYARYSFAETLSRNPLSAELNPRGERNLMNFQNLWGLVKQF